LQYLPELSIIKLEEVEREQIPMRYQKPNLFVYRVAQAISWIAATLIFRLKVGRNDIKNKDGAFLVIANHQCALDFVNLIGATKRPMTFVLSKSFFSTLPIQGILKKMGIIPKQQFQTTVADMKKMKAVVEAGQPLVIYPAGLMCEDGLSTPVPKATYKFLKWMNVDVYMARTEGSYFVMPKWSKKLHPGRTDMDITLLFTKEELAALSLDEIRERTDAVLLYDAYRDQERHPYAYAACEDIQGLENVLYMCPHCGSEHTVQVRDKSIIICTACGFTETMDARGFFHCEDKEKEIRYVSDWSKQIYEAMAKKLREDDSVRIQADVTFRMVDETKHKMVDVGEGSVLLKRGSITLTGTIRGRETNLEVPIVGIPALPFSPGKHLEVQHGENIYRCVFKDGKPVMKFINMLKAFYCLEQAELAKAK